MDEVLNGFKQIVQPIFILMVFLPDTRLLRLRNIKFDFSFCFVLLIGIDFKIRTIELDGKKIKLQIW
jgi:hypothetical protein